MCDIEVPSQRILFNIYGLLMGKGKHLILNLYILISDIAPNTQHIISRTTLEVIQKSCWEAT
jgi:hypothetical protein